MRIIVCMLLSALSKRNASYTFNDSHTHTFRHARTNSTHRVGCCVRYNFVHITTAATAAATAMAILARKNPFNLYLASHFYSIFIIIFGDGIKDERKRRNERVCVCFV